MLTIGLLNNMPDAALQSVERQVCSLLSAASDGRTVHLKLFAPDDACRAPETQAHIDAFYDPFDTLEDQALDALIVTGTEPRGTWLEDEPCWPILSRVADWAELTETPVLWSCMAAHAAVYRLRGVHRRPLQHKLSGLFPCRRERYIHGVPRCWLQPHSRFYGLDRRALVRAGFTIVSSSPETGPDMFALRRYADHFFLQGHPEYGFSTLPGEFRRDVERFLRGERDYYPQPPVGYYGRAVLARLTAFETRARAQPSPSLLDDFDGIACDVASEYSWGAVSAQIYGHWLKRVASIQSRRALPPRPAASGTRVAPGAGVFGALETNVSAWSP